VAGVDKGVSSEIENFVFQVFAFNLIDNDFYFLNYIHNNYIQVMAN